MYTPACRPLLVLVLVQQLTAGLRSCVAAGGICAPALSGAPCSRTWLGWRFLHTSVYVGHISGAVHGTRERDRQGKTLYMRHCPDKAETNPPFPCVARLGPESKHNIAQGSNQEQKTNLARRGINENVRLKGSLFHSCSRIPQPDAVSVLRKVVSSTLPQIPVTPSIVRVRIWQPANEPLPTGRPP